MQQFLEEYGKIIIAVIVVIAIVAVAVFFKDPILNMFKSVFNQFSTKSLSGTGISPSPLP